MGVDIGKAYWSYSGFMRFRIALAAAEEIDLLEMRGFKSALGYDSREAVREWTDESGNDITILRPFLDHSDCDGELTWQDCEQVVDRIEEIINTWDDDVHDHPDRAVDVSRGRTLVAEMRDRITNRRALVFS